MLAVYAEAIEAAGGVNQFAKRAGVQASYVSRTLRGEARISDRLLYAAGLERIVTYRRLREGKGE